MEEFRPIIADSVVLSVINSGEITPGDLIAFGGALALTPPALKTFLAAYGRRMDTLITHPFFGYTISYRRVLEVQARLLARHLTDEIPDYPQFLTRYRGEKVCAIGTWSPMISLMISDFAGCFAA
jgi:CRISPR-associated protein Cas1